MPNIGKNIMEARKRLGMTQEELATKVGYKSKSTINKIELGINDLPQKKIKLFADALGMDPGELMGWNPVSEEEKEKSDARARIAARMFFDESFFELVESLDSLKPKQFNRLRTLMETFFEEAFDEDKD